MKNILTHPLKTMPQVLVALVILGGCKPGGPSTSPPAISLHQAALEGKVEAIRQHIAAGSDLNERDPIGGSSPLITAAAFGQTEAARVLIVAGADVDQPNNDGSTPLHTAAFLCRTEIVQLLLENGADRSVRNQAGATALESVAAPFEAVKGIYDLVGAALGPMGLQLDYERIKAARPAVAYMLQ